MTLHNLFFGGRLEDGGLYHLEGSVPLRSLYYLSAQDRAASESAWLPADVRVTLAVTTAKLR